MSAASLDASRAPPPRTSRPASWIAPNRPVWPILPAGRGPVPSGTLLGVTRPPRLRFAARHLLIVLLAALLLSPGAPPRALSPSAQDPHPAPGVARRDPSPGVPAREPAGSGAPTGRVARPERRVLAAVHRGAGVSAVGGDGAGVSGVGTYAVGGDRSPLAPCSA